MKNQEIEEPKSQEPARQSYEPPKATFVPLKLEERVLGCNLNKNNIFCADYASNSPSS